MKLNEKELRFLTKKLRHRNQGRFVIWVFFAVSLLMFVAALQMPAPFDMQAVGYTVGQTIVLLVWAISHMMGRSDERHLIALVLRFVNDDAESLQQLSAKRGLGDLRS